MFDKKLYEKLINKIIKLGAGYKVNEIEYAIPGQPPFKNKVFAFNVDAKVAVDYLISNIINNDKLSAIFNNKQYNYGLIASSIHPETLVEWLVITSQQSNTVDVVNSLHRFVEMGYTPAYRVLAVSGLKVDKELYITDRISILPLDALKESHQKFTAGPKNIPSLSFRGGSNIADSKYPTAVIRLSIKLRTIIEEQDQFYRMIDESELDELCSFLTLHNDASPMNFHEWIELEEWVPRHSRALTGLLSGGSELDYLKEVALDADSWDLLAPLYEQYTRLRSKDRLAIKSAINRIRNSKVRWSLADRVIDLAVALESILLATNEDRQIANKFSKRACFLLQNANIGEDEKRSADKFFRAFYKCRCDAVHNGEVKQHYTIQEQGKVSSVIFVEQATNFTQHIFKEIIANGRLPDWKRIERG